MPAGLDDRPSGRILDKSQQGGEDAYERARDQDEETIGGVHLRRGEIIQRLADKQGSSGQQGHEVKVSLLD